MSTIDDPSKPRGNPRPVTPDRDPRLHPNSRPQASLVESFGPLVDELRQLNTDFGLRPYRVFSVVARWSGGAVGKGTASVESETELLPTPLLQMSGSHGTGGVRRIMTEGGTSERGEVRMTEVSPRYTEDDIASLFHCQPLPAGLEGYLEVRIDQRDGSTIRRRFVALVPDRRADKFDWSVRLRRQNMNESRTSNVDNVSSPEEVRAHERKAGKW